VVENGFKLYVWGREMTSTFEYPVGVLLFNRPHLAKHVLESLKNSSLPLDEKFLVFHIDGFVGSKNEENFESDKTRKTLHLVRKYFPDAHVISQKTNVGIAKSFYILMSYVFHNFEAEFAVFQEEDVFLKTDYFANMTFFLKAIFNENKIGAASISDFDHYELRRPDKICPTFGTREFALRRDIFLRSQKIYEVYLESIGPKYRTKDLSKINESLAQFGIALPLPFQDVFQHEILRLQGKLHLRLNIPGRFDANFSNGESIPGISILQTLRMLFSHTRKLKLEDKPPQPQEESYSYDLEFLEGEENRIWESRFLGNEQISTKTSQLALIRVRNRLKVSNLNHFIEYIYIFRVRRGT